MGRGDLTAHSFRATFKTWATERTNFPRELVEAAVAHVFDDKPARRHAPEATAAPGGVGRTLCEVRAR
jgi:hypothetical protein